RLEKLVRRNKAVFAAIAAVAAALVLGLGLSTWLFFRERAARREQARLRSQAETQAIRSQQLARVWSEMLRGAGPLKAEGRDTTVLREILEETEKRLSAELKDQPEVEWELRVKIAEIYYQLDENAKAEAACREAVRLAGTAFGNQSREAIRSRKFLAQV